MVLDAFWPISIVGLIAVGVQTIRAKHLFSTAPVSATSPAIVFQAVGEAPAVSAAYSSFNPGCVIRVSSSMTP